MSAVYETGIIGNIWIAKNILPTKGMSVDQHAHEHDHASLLVSGKALVQVGDNEPMLFEAPTFIMVRANRFHKFTAAEDNTVWYCIFALREYDGLPIETSVAESNVPPADILANSIMGDMHYKEMYYTVIEEKDAEIKALREDKEHLEHRLRLMNAGLAVAKKVASEKRS